MTNSNNLTDGDLDQVSGGMSCNAAIAAAKVYCSIAGVFIATGDLEHGAFFLGKASGVMQGAGCPK